MLLIDGSYGEGGGQILRTSVALSALLGEPIRVENIRSNRPKPGLAQQHLTGLKTLARLTDADTKGIELGSTAIEFAPTRIRPGRYEIDIGTAGSISLILQVASLPAAFAGGNVELEITGGTDVPWSPPMDYVRSVFYPTLARMGYSARAEIARRGYYPKGGGKVKVKISPVQTLEPLVLVERGNLVGIRGVAHALNLKEHVLERMANAAKKVLKDYPCDIAQEIGKGFSTGTGITLWAEFENALLGSSSLGKLGKPAEEVGREAGEGLLKEITSACTLDVHMGDQIVPYIAIARGRSRAIVRELTNHLLTNIHVVEEILDVKFETSSLDKGHSIEVEGIGYGR